MYIRSVELTEGIFAGGDASLTSFPAARALGKPALSARPVTFFAGENGSGKSTLLEVIAAAAGFNPEGGSARLRFSMANTPPACINAPSSSGSPPGQGMGISFGRRAFTTWPAPWMKRGAAGFPATAVNPCTGNPMGKLSCAGYEPAGRRGPVYFR